MIKEEYEGNLLDMFHEGKFDAILHGTNCFHAMGAGIARQIAYNYPIAKAIDRLTPYGDIDKLGTYSVAKVVGKGIIINGYTQFLPGANFELLALKEILLSMNKQFKGKNIGVPEIGCGIGGNNWSLVREVIEKYSLDYKITVVHYDSGIKTVGAIKTDSRSKI